MYTLNYRGLNIIKFKVYSLVKGYWVLWVLPDQELSAIVKLCLVPEPKPSIAMMPVVATLRKIRTELL